MLAVRGPSLSAAARQRFALTLIASAIVFAGSEPSRSEEKIGGAQIVINNVEGNLPTGNQAPVAQGDSVFLNESLRSGADSKANLLLNDDSKVTIGPGSTLALDAFVYSGPKQPGTIALNMTKGTLRFVTGDASKRAYTIYTPTAAIGVRGSIVRVESTPTGTRAYFEEGTGFICHREKNEYRTAEELRKRCRGLENEHGKEANRCKGNETGERRERCCPCEAIITGQEATVSPNQITLTEAPPNTIPEPYITEGFGLGGAPLVGAAFLGAAAIGGAIAAGSSSSSGNTPSPPSP
jgi:hypothetical protein